MTLRLLLTFLFISVNQVPFFTFHSDQTCGGNNSHNFRKIMIYPEKKTTFTAVRQKLPVRKKKTINQINKQIILYILSSMSSVDGNTLAGSTRVRGPANGDSFSLCWA